MENKQKYFLEPFLSAFGSMLDISPRQHKKPELPDWQWGIGRHFEAAFGYIAKAMDKQKHPNIDKHFK